MNKLGRGPQRDAIYQISNFYAIQFQKRKKLKMGFFVPLFQLVTPGVGPVLTPGASYEQTWKRSSRRCYIPNIKALGLSFSEKKNFEISFFVPLFQLVTPGQAQFSTQGPHMKKLGRGPLGDSTYQNQSSARSSLREGDF